MAKRTPKSPSTDPATPAPAPAPAPARKSRSGSRAKATSGVAAEMASGQDQAAAASDVFVGVPSNGDEPVQGAGAASVELGALESSTDSVSMSSGPSDDDIRMRAYQRYLERGGGHGLAFDDWLEAERDLKFSR